MIRWRDLEYVMSGGAEQRVYVRTKPPLLQRADVPPVSIDLELLLQLTNLILGHNETSRSHIGVGESLFPNNNACFDLAIENSWHLKGCETLERYVITLSKRESRTSARTLDKPDAIRAPPPAWAQNRVVSTQMKLSPIRSPRAQSTGSIRGDHQARLC